MNNGTDISLSPTGCKALLFERVQLIYSLAEKENIYKETYEIKVPLYPSRPNE